MEREEEVRLIRAYRQTGDANARHALVRAHQPFVYKIAHGYRKYRVPFADLVQEGNVGLLIALDRFNPERGLRLLTYAVWWMRNRMRTYVQRSLTVVRPGRETSPQRDMPLDAGFIDALVDQAPSPEELVGSAEAHAESQTKLRSALRCLSPREAGIIMGRHCEEEPLTFAEIGKTLCISRERVRQQLDERALEKLRAAFAA